MFANSQKGKRTYDASAAIPEPQRPWLLWQRYEVQSCRILMSLTPAFAVLLKYALNQSRVIRRKVLYPQLAQED